MKKVYWTDKLYPCPLAGDGLTVRQMSNKLMLIHEMTRGMIRAARLLTSNNVCLEDEDAGLAHMIEAVGEKLSKEVCDLLPDGVKDAPDNQA